MKIKHPRTRAVILAALMVFGAYTGITLDPATKAAIASAGAELVNGD